MTNEKKYAIGMYGGKFLPFHKGHDSTISLPIVRYAPTMAELTASVTFWQTASIASRAA